MKVLSKDQIDAMQLIELAYFACRDDESMPRAILDHAWTHVEGSWTVGLSDDYLGVASIDYENLTYVACPQENTFALPENDEFDWNDFFAMLIIEASKLAAKTALVCFVADRVLRLLGFRLC